jgi:hypothetical protein
MAKLYYNDKEITCPVKMSKIIALHSSFLALMGEARPYWYGPSRCRHFDWQWIDDNKIGFGRLTLVLPF